MLRAKMDHSLPKHPFDRYIESAGVADSLTKDAKSYDSDIELYAATLGEIVMNYGSPSKSEDARMKFNASLAMRMYARYGKQTFRVPPELQEMFSNTSLANITPDVIGEFPYPCFYIDLPDFGHKIVSSAHGRKSWKEVSGAFLINTINPSGENVWLLYVWAAEDEDAKYLGEDAQFSLGFSHDRWVKSGEDLEAHLSKRYETMKGHGDLTEEQQGQLHEAVVSAFRIAMHLLLYLNGDPEISKDVYGDRRERLKRALARKQNPNSKKARRIEREIERITSSKVNVVAPSLDLPKAKLVKGSKSGLNEDAGRQRHWVRGHWRKQPYGPRDNPKYRMKWIKPHLRGNEGLGDVNGRTYDVE